MWCNRRAILTPILGLTVAVAPAGSQRPDSGRMGMRAGMMGMGHDSATMAQMGVIHELIVNHDRISRTVTNLPDGIRTVTESDDARLATFIKAHVASMDQRVRAGDDPGMPIESDALHSLFRGSDKVRTTTEATARGVVVVQTSSDPATVSLLQQHAAEVSDLVQGGMVAAHAAMMKNGSGMMQHSVHGGMSPSSQDTTRAARPGARGKADSAFTAMQSRGKTAMGVDQYSSTHQFDALADGGRIELQRDVDDSAGVAQIRRHLQEIAKAFASGDFTTPAFVHMQAVPGTEVMAAKRGAITYTYRELPRGGEVRIVTKDREALRAIHEFMAFQRQDHRAAGMNHGEMHR